MTAASQEADIVLAPSGSTAPRAEDRLAGTGTTEDTNATGLLVNCYATIMVGAAAIRVNFGSVTAPTVATTDLIIPAYGRFDWLVTTATAFVSVEAADGAAAYEAWVWSSGQGMGTVV